MPPSQTQNTQTDIIAKAGINPKTLLVRFLYWQKLERNVNLLLFLPFLILIILLSLTQKTNSATQPPTWENWLIVVALSGLLLGIFYNLWANLMVTKIYDWRVRVFASKNNLQLIPKSKLVGLLPDTLRHIDAHGVHAQGIAVPVSGQQITVFDYRCAVGYGKHEQHFTNGLAVLQLKDSYPHLFLDSKKNGKNHQYAASQKVELEGDFSKYFDLYIPEGSAAGSLTVFAPDMMQTILDTGKLFDVEIDGNKAVIISDELVFTKAELPRILNCAAGLTKEFKQLDKTWQPIFTPSGDKFRLKGQPLWRILLISLLPVFAVLAFRILPENIQHPIKNQPTASCANSIQSPTGICSSSSATCTFTPSDSNCPSAVQLNACYGINLPAGSVITKSASCDVTATFNLKGANGAQKEYKILISTQTVPSGTLYPLAKIGYSDAVTDYYYPSGLSYKKGIADLPTTDIIHPDPSSGGMVETWAIDSTQRLISADGSQSYITIVTFPKEDPVNSEITKSTSSLIIYKTRLSQ